MVDQSVELTGLDPEVLDPEIYHAVIGPALQAAAEVAASRGDPTLAADMPAMLALIDLVTQLRAHWRTQHPGAKAEAASLADAPAAACVMVLRQAEMQSAAVGQCLSALETAYARLSEDAVTHTAHPAIARAGEALRAGQREDAVSQLKHAARQIAAAIDAWKTQPH